MTQEVVKLGSLLKGGKHRDAIHIAIAPVTAANDLSPGDRIGFSEKGNCNLVTDEGMVDGKFYGIVDPWLKKKVKKGQQFYMLLDPLTITSLRHEWTHPAFAATEIVDDAKRQSEAWLRKFADSWNFDYDDMISEAESRNGIVVARDRDLHGPADLDPGEESLFWHHMEVLTGREFGDDHRDDLCWSCSC